MLRVKMTSTKPKQAACYLLFLLARILYKIADIIYPTYGEDVLQHLKSFLRHEDVHLRQEASHAYKEWQGVKSISGTDIKDRGIFNFADLE